MKRCPCCGYLTIDDTNEVIDDICEVCFWQYDEVAQDMLLFSTLNDASLFTLKGTIYA